MMGGTAENLARDFQIGREETDAYAAASFAKAYEHGQYAQKLGSQSLYS